VPDAIYGAGPGPAGGHVKAFDGRTGAEVRSFLAFEGFAGGTYVGSGDVDGDNFADLIVGAGPGPVGGHVKVFSGQTGALLQSFLAFDGYAGGVRVAGGDVDGGTDDIIVGAGPGAPGGHVKVFSGQTQALLRSFFSVPGFTGGVFVGAADLQGDGSDEILTGNDAGGLPLVQAFAERDQALLAFLAYDARFSGGVRVAGVDADADADDEVVTGSGLGAAGHAAVFGGDGGLLDSLLVGDPRSPVGTYVA
jgi:hypothetical protein